MELRDHLVEPLEHRKGAADRIGHRQASQQQVLGHVWAEAIEDRGRREDGARSGNLIFAWELARLVAQRRASFQPALEVLGRRCVHRLP